jgi:hypothetical protein
MKKTTKTVNKINYIKNENFTKAILATDNTDLKNIYRKITSAPAQKYIDNLLNNFYNDDIDLYSAQARMSPEDEYSTEKGMTIAYARLLKKVYLSRYKKMYDLACYFFECYKKTIVYCNKFLDMVDKYVDQEDSAMK